MRGSGPIKPETALPSEPQVGSSAWLDADVKTVSVNSVRWLCPNCVHANAACASALGHVFICEKCGTRARVVMHKASSADLSEPGATI